MDKGIKISADINSFAVLLFPKQAVHRHSLCCWLTFCVYQRVGRKERERSEGGGRACAIIQYSDSCFVCLCLCKIMISPCDSGILAPSQLYLLLVCTDETPAKHMYIKVKQVKRLCCLCPLVVTHMKALLMSAFIDRNSANHGQLRQIIQYFPTYMVPPYVSDNVYIWNVSSLSTAYGYKIVVRWQHVDKYLFDYSFFETWYFWFVHAELHVDTNTNTMY